jgi:hypothetical protein
MFVAFVLYAGYMRSKLRQKYNIVSNPECCMCEDNYLPWVFCTACSLCQEARTLKHVDDGGAFAAGACMAPAMQQPLMGGYQAYGQAPVTMGYQAQATPPPMQQLPPKQV